MENEFSKKNKKDRPPLVKIGKYFIYVFTGIILLLIILFIINYQATINLYKYSMAGKDNFMAAQNHIKNQDFSETTLQLREAEENFGKAQENLKKLNEFKYLPVFSRQYKALENILLATSQTASGIRKISELASSIIIAINKEGQDVSLASITPEEKRIILEKVYESPPELQGVKAEIDLAVSLVEKIPDSFLFPTIRKAKEPLEEYLPQIQETIGEAIPFTQTIPPLAGYPSEKTYLFLLQNNTELRPTGGFIGTYGILKLKDGEISDFHTDNVYNLDEPFKDTLIAEAPWPLQKYLKAQKWFFRDSNWSPDFPTTAQKAEWFYHQENGAEQNLNGVIAVTPTFIESLLEITGEINVDGVNFNSDNVVEVLEYQVEKGFYRQGISDAERKEIIGDLSNKIMDKLMALPQNRWPDLWKIIEKDIREKQILVYLKDTESQKLIIEQNWGGEIKATAGDYLAIFDANLASLKTDPAVNRSIDYHLEKNESGDLIAKVTITYVSDASFDWKTTRYRTYARFYVPEGSELIEYSGFMENDKLHGGKPGEVEVSNEFGKTQFGGFISIEPKETGVLVLKYKLPQSIKEKVSGNYQLLVQKQPGTISHNLTVSVDLRSKIKDFAPLDKGQKVTDNGILFQTDLREDREFNIIF